MTSTKRITDYLIEDHVRLGALLDAACDGGNFDGEAFAAFRAGLLRHIAIEEKVLLRAVLDARKGRPIDRAHDMQIDHAAITSLLVPEPDVALCGEIRSLLEPHDEKEEGPGGIYAECEQILGDDSERLAGVAAAFPDVRVAPYRSLPGVKRTAAAAMESARKMRPRGSGD